MKPETPQQAAQRFSEPLLRQGFQKQALHVYHNAEGQAWYWRIRLKHVERDEKWIRPLSCNAEGKFVLREPMFVNKKPLYRLPELLQTKAIPVWVVEGEWCADHLAQKGLVVTTSGSVESVATTDWSPLAGREVIIWPDADEAGKRYAQAVSGALIPLGCQISWVAVESLALPSKGDAVDWLLAHPDATREHLEALPQREPLLDPPSHASSSLTPSDVGVFTQPEFIYHSSGVFYRASAEAMIKICAALQVAALVCDESSENWGRLLVFQDADGAWHRFAMPMEMLKGSGEELRGELLRQGLEIAAGAKVRSLLAEYIMTAKPDARARCVNRVGWYKGVFVLPQETLGESQEQVLYQAHQPVKDYQSLGCLADWRTHVAIPSRGNSRLVLALSCAFAGMLLEPSGVESGGLHFVGESSTGKTTALRIAASVYGSPSYVNRWRATTNGLEVLATLRSDTLLILDELAQVDPREAGEVAYLLANGSGKTRAKRSGAVRTTQSWRLLFLSAGEIGLTQHMQGASKATYVGQEVRLVEIPADAGAGLGLFETLQGYPHAAALSQSLVEASSHYYGTAALAFLEAITKPDELQGLPQRIRALQQDFLVHQLPPDASGQVHRVGERFALIAVAGELASQYGITGWESGEAVKAAQTCFNAWLDQRGHRGNQERVAILDQVQAFFEAHGLSRFEDIHARGEQRIMNRVGFRRTNAQAEYEYLVLPEMFRRELCQGFNPQLVKQVLVQAGMLKVSSEGKPLTPHRLGSEGVKKCYQFIRTEPQAVEIRY